IDEKLKAAKQERESANQKETDAIKNKADFEKEIQAKFADFIKPTLTSLSVQNPGPLSSGGYLFLNPLSIEPSISAVEFALANPLRVLATAEGPTYNIPAVNQAKLVEYLRRNIKSFPGSSNTEQSRAIALDKAIAQAQLQVSDISKTIE